MTKQVLIPDSPTPIISVFEGCDGVPYRFTDSSRVSGVFDPTTQSTWIINSQVLYGRTVEILLLQGLPQDVILDSFSPAGCAGTVSTTVTPGPRPTANFRILDSTFLQAPFSIRFQNRSSNVTAVKWLFGDGDSSTALNPTHIYNQEGVYTVTLIAFKPGGCSDTLNRVLNLVINAQPNVQVTQGFAVQNGNELNITAEILNKGNVALSTLQLNLGLNSDATLQEILNSTIRPGETISYTFKSKVLSNSSKTVDIACIEAIIPGSKPDVNLSDNRLCISATQRFAVLPLTPNPVDNEVKVRYVLPNSGNVKITVIDVLGKEVAVITEGNQNAGVMEVNFNAKSLRSGYYNLRVRFENQNKFQRFFKN
jgi:PKD repeat protein